ncbi:hypothetical protein [Rivularia sp. UHCC 0363]|uniref:hypothetical protein n=1 Tax=Rivularia sp. UHCC 0363 TaxID=3110244 RepID=UPI002B21FCE0|nr:hypothetical protein [Rivularia sp. UHCC 0363]MEA5596687.1 hypothetical protein [Rivularia sp. UHCC 0363]
MVKKKNYYLLFVFSCWIFISNPLNYPALAAKSVVNNPKENSCSNKDLASLTTKLMRDLPAYFNRATQRARRLDRSVQVYSYMLVAGKPDFQPLPLRSWTDEADKSANGKNGVEQIFFTTLERQYVKGKAVQLQDFHWLFLTKTESGWRVAMMYSQTGGYPKQQPPTPPRESSDSAVAQGIKTWLRDCRAGSLRF